MSAQRKFFKLTRKRLTQRLTHWLIAEDRSGKSTHHEQHSWWKVMCLTGVDYFSTLGYQPGIAALAAGSLSPIATFILVMITLFGALPIYKKVASISPHGEGSISMLERLLRWWQGKMFVLCLLGFVTTDFIITITLSAADATAHIVENPFIPDFLHHQNIPITLLLVCLLGAVFLKGFQEAIGLAVVLVIAYLTLNFVTIAVGLEHVITHPALIQDWRRAIFANHGNPLMILGTVLIVFPKLALGLSGFETGVAVMPLVKGGEGSDEIPGRIRNTHKLLSSAAIVMSFFLMTSSFVTTLLIEPALFQKGGPANGRALAYLAHSYLGDWFGTLYDLSTISILWFAGASAMAGLLNIVPRYLPRYGMAPNWARATRPLVLVYTVIAIVVTILFKADVELQAGAYATGVLVLMSSAAYAVTLSAYQRRSKRRTVMFGLITLVFFYTTIANIIERPDGVKIAGFFILTIVLTSLFSRVWRSTEIRTEAIEVDDLAAQFIQSDSDHNIRLIAHRSRNGGNSEYYFKEQEIRNDNDIPEKAPVIFLEVKISDASEFEGAIVVEGVEIEGYRVLRVQSPAVPNAIAAVLLHIRNETGRIPHAYFGWVEGNPVQYLMRYLLFGEGDTAVVTREVLRRAESNPKKRPSIHVSG
jgi:hypothetical protein